MICALKFLHRLAVISTASALAVTALPAAAINFLTEENPPFNFAASGKVAGAATELVTEMAKRASVPASFRVMEWDIAYRQAQADKDTCLFSVARLENRENQFQWVGELATNKWAVFGRSDFARPLKTVTDLRPLKIGGVVQDAKVEYLKSRSVTNIREVLRDEQNPPRLFLKAEDPNYIDLWVTSYFSGNEIAEKAKAGPVKMVMVLRETPLWLVCSPRTDKGDIKKLADALATMNKDGSRKRILDALEKRVR
jgi:polar amino acid transport system substrate-binding protein